MVFRKHLFSCGEMVSRVAVDDRDIARGSNPKSSRVTTCSWFESRRESLFS